MKNKKTFGQDVNILLAELTAAVDKFIKAQEMIPQIEQEMLRMVGTPEYNADTYQFGITHFYNYVQAKEEP